MESHRRKRNVTFAAPTRFGTREAGILTWAGKESVLFARGASPIDSQRKWPKKAPRESTGDAPWAIGDDRFLHEARAVVKGLERTLFVSIYFPSWRGAIFQVSVIAVQEYNRRGVLLPLRLALLRMDPTRLILNRQSGLLRAGWRAAIFIALLFSPYLIIGSISRRGETVETEVLDVSLGMALTYVLLIAWTMAVSWFCLRFLERMKLSALGFAPRGGWLGDVLKGCVIGALMIASVVALQIVAGGARLRPNPILRGERGIDWAGLRTVAAEMVAAVALLILAAAFEELVFRGYAFQTLLRGAPAVVPILIFSTYFGWAHWNNPSRTLFSTANTALAGVWLSVAYLKTRNLWFPTALHFAWNWTMGAFFGVPVSGLRMPRHSLLVLSGGGPDWLTGGAYGSEGGAAATAALVVATVLIWRARWLRVSPEMTATLLERAPNRESAINLELGSDSKGENRSLWPD